MLPIMTKCEHEVQSIARAHVAAQIRATRATFSKCSVATWKSLEEVFSNFVEISSNNLECFVLTRLRIFFLGCSSSYTYVGLRHISRWIYEDYTQIYTLMRLLIHILVATGSRPTCFNFLNRMKNSRSDVPTMILLLNINRTLAVHCSLYELIAKYVDSLRWLNASRTHTHSKICIASLIRSSLHCWLFDVIQ